MTGFINGQLQHAVAAGNVPGMVDAMAKLAASAGIIRTDDLRLQQVMDHVAQAIPVICRDGSPDQLDAAITACQQASQNASSPLIKAAFQALLGTLLVGKAGRTGHIGDLEAAINAFQQAADTVPEGQPVRAAYLDRLVALRGMRSAFAEAEPEAEHDEQLEQLAVEGSDLIHEAVRAADPAMLVAAMDRLRRALDLAPAQSPKRPALMSEIGLALWHRYQLTGALAALDDAVDAQQQAVGAASAGDAHRAAYLANLSNMLRARFERLGALADLEAAAEASGQALDLCAAGDPVRAVVLSQRGLLLLDQYRYTGSLDRLNEAVSIGQQAVDAVADETGRAPFLMNLGLSLTARFERTGDLADANAAVEATRQARDSAGPADRNRASYLTSYASALRLRADRTGTLADISAAVENDEQAVAASSPGDPGHAMRIAHLGVSLLSRFGLTGDPADLDAAVDFGERSVAALAERDPFRALCLTNLSGSLLRRFERNGALADLNAAVDDAQRAADVLRDADPGRARCLGNLANVLQARFARRGEPDDLDRAVQASRQAVAACPAYDANRGSYLNSLANALQLRFRRTAGESDLEESIDYSRRALAAMPRDHALRGPVLAGLSLGLILRFSQAHEAQDLDDAVDAASSAVRAADPDDPNRTLFLGRLILALSLRFGLTGTPTDLNEGLEAGREAAAMKAAAPSIRAGAAVMWGGLAARARSWPEAVRAYRAAIELLGRVAPRGLGRGDQEHQLIGISGIGSRAASCCLELGDSDLAVELLEQGRGVLLGQALDTHADLTLLAGVRPDLATRFAQLRDRLAVAPGGLGQPLTGDLADSAAAASRAAQRQRQDGESLEAVIAEARRLPGLERFLLPPTAEDLLHAAENGPVAMITVDEIRSDALLLTPAGVQVVRLPGLSATTVAEHTAEFLSALEAISNAAPDSDAEAEARLTAVLGWLWDTVADPVLDSLGLTRRPAADETWPRIWWCPSGLLSLLPLHAAGHHGTRFSDPPQTVVDRVASSYAATARTLLHARRPVPADAAASIGQVLVVAMAHTPGASDLKAAPAEADVLTRKFGAQAKVLHDQADAALATSESVLDAMPEYPWAHFACHAAGSLADPSASHVLLHDHASRPLTVLDVARLRLQRAELAFLSACSTAMTGGPLPDEAINLASSFQLAGYRRVIATLWPVDDELAADLASDFYDSVGSAGTQDAAALALHDAARLYRDIYANQPSMWAAHIHAGL